MTLLNFLLLVNLTAADPAAYLVPPSGALSNLAEDEDLGGTRRKPEEMIPLQGKLRVHGGYATCRRNRREVCGFTDGAPIGMRYFFPSDYPGPYPENAYKDPATGMMVVDKVKVETGSDGEGEYTNIHF